MAVWIKVKLFGDSTLVNAENIDLIFLGVNPSRSKYVLYAMQGELQIPLAESDNEGTIKSMLSGLLAFIQAGKGLDAQKVPVIENRGTEFVWGGV
ncbi:hypothetical protein E2N92_10220 [Methanofollis formosanus]|uniref:Uncharacterized protein n=1 Tax=Methanofollis formosanus TaxID=299308 RepID=A0A8G1A302_9EURY|nr:hypothetical protein [Methanofollis formosanus]QYZ79778.1 hypothetical protein E2N92_10220 [Methanofollis formosanus]